jgi:hypothetical protein
VTYFIPRPPVPDPKTLPPIGIVVDGGGAIYAASDDQKDIKKYVKNRSGGIDTRRAVRATRRLSHLFPSFRRIGARAASKIEETRPVSPH